MNLNLLYPKYTTLRKANPEFARKCVIEAYLSVKNISLVAQLFNTTRNSKKHNS